ncbi:hypothetical protein [Frankia sp. AgW1.1]|uniref:hypothetical protein n=1 Tax=Frankia sp. AgW1.1 TaxID=1836971 RepID=UPI0019329722|nr:hypothetical protein [Frankia sp. AgW1.1]MBL7487030.1 hypothetical protein [Frankia sp. AgW1.1]
MKKTSIRTLQPGETPPQAEPRRYPNANGYIRLRWKTGPRSYVECYEHRLVAGVVTDDHVHHKNHDRADNRGDNLQILSPEAHAAEHGLELRTWDRASGAAMYRGGATVVQIAEHFGINNATVSRALRREGVQMRNSGAHRRMDITDDVIRLRRGGASIHEIAGALGVSTTPVARVLREADLPRLPRGNRGSATAHDAIHANPQAATAVGLLIPSWARRSEVPVDDP